MGGEHTRSRKHLHFCIAFLTLLSGCAPVLKERIELREAHESLRRSQLYLTQGNYQGALKENQKVLSLSQDGAPRDEALFNIGLILARSGNPQRDLGKSIVYFRRMIKEHPRSSLVGQAKTWLDVLEDIQRLNEENQRLGKEVGKLNLIIERSKQVDIEIERKKRNEIR